MDFNKVSNVGELAQDFGAACSRNAFSIAPDSGTQILGLGAPAAKASFEPSPASLNF